MSEQVKNLFKHKIPFHLRENIIEKHGMGIHDISLYRSVLITSPLDIDIYDSRNIYSKVKSFLNYLVSKHITTKHEGLTYSSSFFEIGITYDSGEGHRGYEKLITVEHETTITVEDENTIHDDEFLHSESVIISKESHSEKVIIFKKFDPYKIYSGSIVIDIDAYGRYWQEVESEVESEVELLDYANEKEDTTPIAISKPFHSDQCVVCLSKKKQKFYS